MQHKRLLIAAQAVGVCMPMTSKLPRQSESRIPSSEERDRFSPHDLHPSDFMRARHPELFSDSATVAQPQLSREILEYQLETLTRRKQETEFEYFCRKLAEKELCPNLLPQTGPTGGGDSKADSETYPVADDIALRWYEGVGREASRERWAFAFSAKKQWRAKIKSDVEKIVQTGRNYRLVYFVTSQFVRDKVRADVEDDLRKRHGIDVRILDREWILKCVFEHDRVRLAAETLNLTAYDQTTHRVIGPHDVEREMELKELDEQIDEPSRYRGAEYQLAEDCLQSALLARGLEHPRVEVEGRLLRAERVAERVNHRQQRLRIAYARAWTAFWWYDDSQELNRLYDQVEEFSAGSMQSSDLELVANLWTVLNTTVRRGQLALDTAKLDKRTAQLKAELERLAGDGKRPNNALMARTSRLLMDLVETVSDARSLEGVLANLRGILAASEGLAEFPFESIARITLELGEFLADNSAYDELFEDVVGLSERRAGTGQAGLALLRRGYQQLRASRHYDAIRLLGRAQQKLAMREYREPWVAALAGCGMAYEAAGLLWAARANMLVATGQALAEYWEHGEILPHALMCLQRLVWLELQLGRVFCVLDSMELASAVANQLILGSAGEDAFLKERETQDLVLGLLLLKTPVWELKWLGFLPPVLDRLGLHHSWIALLYALGHEDHLRSEGVIPATDSPASTRDLFVRWLGQPAKDDLPEQPELLRERRITLHSFVLGCEVTVEAPNTASSICFAETILSALEALLATSFDQPLYPFRAELRVVIEASHLIHDLPEHEVNEADGGQTIVVRHAPGIRIRTPKEQETFRRWLLAFLLEVTFQIAVASDADAFMHRVADDELGFGRALSFSDTAISTKNAFGREPRFRLSDWETQAGTERFMLRRNLPWDHGLVQAHDEADEASWQPGEGEPPNELFGVDSLKHKDRRVFSLINKPLWDKAEWQATGYIFAAESVPVMALGFADAEFARRIFREWRDKLGSIDEQERLRVSIITGVDKKHPSHYRVLISMNPLFRRDSPNKQYIITARIHHMEPPDSHNLNCFLEQYKRAGRYVLLPGHFESSPPRLFWEVGIEKRELHVRPAWQIGANDLDVVAIQEDDEPIIPDESTEAPVLGALQRFEKRRKRTRH